MINVDGDYEEIVRYLDEHGVNGIAYNSHGEIVNFVRYDEFGEAHDSVMHLNYGIFSLIDSTEDHRENGCPICVPGPSFAMFRYIHDPRADDNVTMALRWGLKSVVEDTASVRF